MNTLKESVGFIGRTLAVIALGTALAACGDNASTASSAGTATIAIPRSGPRSSTGLTSTPASTPTPASSSSSTGSNPTAPTPQADSITLSWAAPTENTDGSALTNLSGFDIYYGTSASALTQKISINSVGLLTYVVANLTSGTWYFEVIAVNASGVQSSPSGLVSVTI